MDWLGWALLVWAVAMLGGFALVGYWIGLNRAGKRTPQAAQPREVVPGATPLADLMNDEFSQTAARPTLVQRTDTSTYLDARAVTGEVLPPRRGRGPRHVSTETVGIPVIDVRA